MAEVYSTNRQYDNFFSTTLSQALADTGVGEYEVYIADEPTDDVVYFVLEPNATNKREIIKCWKPTGAWPGYMLTKDAYRGLTGANAATAHLSGVTVEMRNVAQYFGDIDQYSRSVKGGYVEVDSGLALKIAPFYGEISGVRVAYNGTTHFEYVSPVDGSTGTGVDTQSVTDDSTNYVELTSAGAIAINTTGWTSSVKYKRLAIVVAASGSITSVVDARDFGCVTPLLVSSITAGAGLTNSGTSTDPVLDIAAADSTITVAADSIAVNQAADFAWSGTHNFTGTLQLNGTDISSSFVTSFGEFAGTSVTGAVTIEEGSNVTITRSGNNFTIAAATTGTTSTFLQETPAGTIDGANTTFTVSHAPASPQSLYLFLDGIKVPYGIGAGKYTVSGTTITMGTAPTTGATLDATIIY